MTNPFHCEFDTLKDNHAINSAEIAEIANKTTYIGKISMHILNPRDAMCDA